MGLQKNAPEIEVLIAGNSHANYGVDPNCFSFNTYNIANVGQTIYFDRRIILSNIETLHKLKYVFISVDYHSLYSSSQGIRDAWSYYDNGIKYKNNSYIKENISPFLFGYTAKGSITLLKKDIKRRLIYKSKKTIDFDVQEGIVYTDTISKGFIGFTGNSNQFNPNAYTRRASFFARMINPGASIKKEILGDLEQLIVELKAKNIEVILFVTPTFREYNNYLNKNVVAQNEKDIHSLLLKYNIEYWTYYNSSQFNQKDFFDCDHLNKEGAKKFSTLLSEKLIAYDTIHNRIVQKMD